jgi:uncharacterized protein YndB with AHSA1/START domain
MNNRNMKRLFFHKTIQADPSYIWRMMWSKNTFPLWMSPMGEGHFYEPALIQGERIKWLTPNGDGMFGIVEELVPNQKIVFKHQGWIQNGALLLDEPFESFEIYQLSFDGKNTVVELAVDTFPEYVELMQEKYPLVLDQLEILCQAALSSQN